MTIDTDRGHPSNRIEQANLNTSHGELKSALDQLGAKEATPLQAAQGTLDDAIDQLSHQIRQLEDRLQDVLQPEPEEGDFPQPPPAVPRCSNAVRRVQQQRDRIDVLHGNIVELMNRLEC